MTNDVRKFLDPLVRRVRLALGRGIVKLVNDAAGIQKIQLSLMQNETRSNIERFMEYGFSSHPLTGAEAAVIFMGGNRDHGIIIAVDDRRYRLKNLEAGEVALYTDEGDSIILKRGNKVQINTNIFEVNAETKISFNTPIVEATGDIIDQLNTGGVTIQGMRNIYNTHTHPENDGPGPTAVPNQLME